MNARRLASRLVLVLTLAALGVADAFAVRRTEDPLGLVPADAATVAVLHWNELRSSPLGAQVFAQMDGMSTDGDGARFLRETGLTPSRDIDTVVLAMSRRGGDATGDALVVFEGRFDLVRMGTALTARGATLQKGPAGAYYRLASGHGGNDGAVALVNGGLLIAGSEAAVVGALGRRESGGDGGLLSGQGLGKSLGRVDRDASAWALVDLTRLPSTTHHAARVDVESPEDGQVRAIAGAMKSVSLLALQATVRGDAVDVSATGLTTDAESRQLLEDSLRGVLAMWRMAIQEKSPELVAVLRAFKVESDADGVSISGTLPASFLKSMTAHHQASVR
ncbi:MAG TPA: hypothetical protein VMH79_02425 [Thermoanaerobaculia bacterium]|nr:hypothetical protein [Thermoanaerobaculia bacterium]